MRQTVPYGTNVLIGDDAVFDGCIAAAPNLVIEGNYAWVLLGLDGCDAQLSQAGVTGQVPNDPLRPRNLWH